MSMSIETEEPNLPKPFIELEADYDEHEGKYGVLLKVKSKPWEDLFKKLSGGKISFQKNNGVEGEFYAFPASLGEKAFVDLAFPTTLKELLHYEPGRGESLVSLYYLRTPGLSKGIEVFYPGIFEGETIKKYALKMGERAESLYKKLSPGSVKMKMWISASHE